MSRNERADRLIAGEGGTFRVRARRSWCLRLDHAHARSAAVMGTVLGWASVGAGRRESYDPFRPVMDTLPMKRAMQGAMSDAGVGRVSAVSANGSASVMYDPLEARAIEEHFGSSVPPVYSIKGGLGQTGAVTPVLQVIAAARTATMGLAPPTVNCEHPEVSLDIVRDGARRLGPGPVLCQAIGFGGHYFGASVVGAAT